MSTAKREEMKNLRNQVLEASFSGDTDKLVIDPELSTVSLRDDEKISTMKKVAATRFRGGFRTSQGRYCGNSIL